MTSTLTTPELADKSECSEVYINMLRRMNVIRPACVVEVKKIGRHQKEYRWHPGTVETVRGEKAAGLARRSNHKNRAALDNRSRCIPNKHYCPTLRKLLIRTGGALRVGLVASDIVGAVGYD